MKNTTLIGLIILFLVDLIAFSFFIELQPKNLTVSFFDVGQGDCILIETPQNHQIIIDGGPKSDVALQKIYSNIPWWDKTIDLVILTHPESDHLRGLFSILDNYQVENIAWTGVDNGDEIRDQWEKIIYNEGANVATINKGDKIIASDIVLDILGPQEDLRDKEVKETNDTSVVAKLLFKDVSFLFPGDISSKIEKTLINENIDVDVLKIPHHGSKYSTSEIFLEKTSPLMAIIQVGKNTYGHPTEEVLTRLSNSGIKILRNDINGDVKIVSDGKNYKIITNK
ncbi:MAG: MBL fold metallo-hydrolase [Candidatus Pacebacteria bacterium]|nr:MBL fold metallo-hydrolase [Candidatus Paceibacterota bacterium]